MNECCGEALARAQLAEKRLSDAQQQIAELKGVLECERAASAILDAFSAVPVPYVCDASGEAAG